MSKQTFLEFITNGQYQSQIVSGGIVQSSPTYTPISESPIGWEKNEVQWVRKAGYWGVIKSFVTNLTFIEEAAQIIRFYLYGTGIDTVLYFIILKLDSAFGAGMIHNSWYKGQFALETAKDGDLGVEVNLTEGGFYKDFEARKSTPFEYPMAEDPDVCSLENDGMEIDQNTKFGISDGILPQNNGPHAIDLNKLSDESVSEIATGSVNRTHFSNNDELRANALPFLQTGATSTELICEWDYNVLNRLADGISQNPFAGSAMILRWFNTGGDNTAVGAAEIAVYGGPTTPDFDFYNINHHVVGSATVVIPPGMDVYLIQVPKIGDNILSGSNADLIYWYYANNPADFFRIRYNYRYPTTIMDVFRAVDLGEKLHRSCSDGVSGMVSDLLSADQNLLVTNGDTIRGLKGSVKTTLQSYLKSVDAVRCVSYAIENNQGKLEGRTYAFDLATQITNLGEAKIPDTDYLKYANDLLYNLIKMGYPTKEIGKVNGRFSFNNTTIWKTPLKSVQNTYEQISDYLADPFLIELYRINLDNKSTTDDKSDSENFWIDGEKVYADVPAQDMEFFAWSSNTIGQINITGVVGLNLKAGIKFKVLSGSNAGTYTIDNVFESAGSTIIYVTAAFVVGTINTGIEFRHYKLRRIAYDSITGIYRPDSVYNIELSPARLFLLHAAWIHSSMDEFESGTITFQTTDKNALLVTTLGTVIIAENQNFAIASLPPKIFKPKYMEFEVESPYNLTEVMDANPRGFFLYQEDGVNRKGYPMSISTVPETLETQTYKLLSLPDNDFKNRK